LLYVPGDRRDRLDGATDRGADALIVDLEDAVPVARKELARETVALWLGEERHGATQLWVRINAASADADIPACVTAGVTGLVLPKAEVRLLEEVDEQLAAREAVLDVPRGRFAVLQQRPASRLRLRVARTEGRAAARHRGADGRRPDRCLLPESVGSPLESSPG
jgi:hypothetical protein